MRQCKTEMHLQQSNQPLLLELLTAPGWTDGSPAPCWRKNSSTASQSLPGPEKTQSEIKHFIKRAPNSHSLPPKNELAKKKKMMRKCEKGGKSSDSAHPKRSPGSGWRSETPGPACCRPATAPHSHPPTEKYSKRLLRRLQVALQRPLLAQRSHCPDLVLHGEKAPSANPLQGEGLNQGPLLHHEHIEPLNMSWERGRGALSRRSQRRPVSGGVDTRVQQQYANLPWELKGTPMRWQSCTMVTKLETLNSSAASSSSY